MRLSMVLGLAVVMVGNCAFASPALGYRVCPDDWQGVDLSECRLVDGTPPVAGVTVYYQSPSGLKPYR